MVLSRTGVCKNQLRRSGPKGLDRARGNGPDHSYNKQALYARLLLTPQLRGGVYSTLVSVSKKLSPVLVFSESRGERAKKKRPSQEASRQSKQAGVVSPPEVGASTVVVQFPSCV